LANAEQAHASTYRLIVVGGHTRSIGKTQLVCDLVAALPEANFIAGKITQYGHGVCAQNGEHCGCAPDEHASAFSWEESTTSGTDSARFLAAGAQRAFWLRTKQGFLAEGLPVLRESLSSLGTDAAEGPLNVIVESNSLLQFLKPSLYLTVLDPRKEDFKPSARTALDRADAFVLRNDLAVAAAAWPQVSWKLFQERPAFLQKEGEPLPEPLVSLVRESLTRQAGVRI
jgi:hypothetical protein